MVAGVAMTSNVVECILHDFLLCGDRGLVGRRDGRVPGRLDDVVPIVAGEGEGGVVCRALGSKRRRGEEGRLRLTLEMMNPA